MHYDLRVLIRLQTNNLRIQTIKAFRSLNYHILISKRWKIPQTHKDIHPFWSASVTQARSPAKLPAGLHMFEIPLGRPWSHLTLKSKNRVV